VRECVLERVFLLERERERERERQRYRLKERRQRDKLKHIQSDR
jgi:hypothetical protein